jgi:hypothetical protein
VSTLLQRVDHLVYATPDVERSVDELATLLGVRAAPGGRHQGRGTRNALIALSDTSYLEIIGPDPAQAASQPPRWFGIGDLTAPRLVTWAIKGSDLQSIVANAAGAGVHVGEVGEGRRLRADGVELAWAYTDPTVIVGDGLVPFFIDWRDSSHPATTAPRGPTLVRLRAEHPVPVAIRTALSALEIDLPLSQGPAARLVATLSTPHGQVNLE